MSRTWALCGSTLCRQTVLPCIWRSCSPLSVCKIWIQFSNERSLCWTFIFTVELLYQCLVNRLFSTSEIIYLDFFFLFKTLVENVCLLEGHHMLLIWRLTDLYCLKSTLSASRSTGRRLNGCYILKRTGNCSLGFQCLSDELSSSLIQSPGSLDFYTLRSLQNWKL